MPEPWLVPGIADMPDLVGAGWVAPVAVLGVVLLAQAASRKAGTASTAGAQWRYRIEFLRS
jgi:hypothetical protein